MENNEIINSLMEEKSKLENEFNRVVNELAILEQQFTAKKSQLEDSREQIRGAYAVLYGQLEKFGAIKREESVVETTNDTPAKEEVKDEQPYLTDDETTISTEKVDEPKTSKKSTNKKEVNKKEKVVAGLTPEEIEKINKAVTKPASKDVNGNEIPDYLQTEYNK